MASRSTATRRPATRATRRSGRAGPSQCYDWSKDSESESDFEPSDSDQSDLGTDDDPEADEDLESVGIETNSESDDRGWQSLGFEDGSDAEMDDVFEIADEVRRLSADPSAVTDEGLDDCAHMDGVADPDALFDGNLRPAEYYREQLHATDPDQFRRKEYAKGTEKLILNTETQWRLSVLFHLPCTHGLD